MEQDEGAVADKMEGNSRTLRLRALGSALWRGLTRLALILGLREERTFGSVALLDALKERYGEFKSLLTANNDLLEIIADLERSLRGDRPFSFGYLKTKSKRAVAATRQMVSGLQSISGDHYVALWPAFERVKQKLSWVLDDQLAPQTDEWILPLSSLESSLAWQVGNKMGNLGELHNRLSLPVPDGFAITTSATKFFLEESGVAGLIAEVAEHASSDVEGGSRRITEAILASAVPEDLAVELLGAYEALPSPSGRPHRVALRSSALQEDSAASFAGQYATELNVLGEEALLDAYRRVVASLYRPQAIFYRKHMGIAEEDVAMGVGCVVMVDAVASGVAFSRDPVGSDQVVIHAVWGLGPSVVDGRVNPDMYRVPRESGSVVALPVEIRLGQKTTQLLSEEGGGIREEAVREGAWGKACLEEGEIRRLAEWVLRLEDHFGAPQDVEWALDGERQLYVLQSRPMRQAVERQEEARGAIAGQRVLLEGGEVASPGVGCGKVVQVRGPEDLARFPEGGVLVARHSSPEYVQVMDRAVGIVTDVGSAIGHMASLAREFRVPTLLGTKVATKVLGDGMEVTVDSQQGRVYEGRVCELLEGREEVRAFMKGTPVYEDLERVAEAVIPLKLTQPGSIGFVPESCETLHDIARYVHEKAFAEMFGIGALIEDLPRQAVQLDVFLPIDMYIIDLGGGLAVKESERRVKRSQILSYPLAQLVKGMLHEGIPRFGARPMDAAGFFGVMMRHAMMSPEEEQSFRDPSYAIVSDKYLNFTSRVGYHFSAIDSYCGDTLSKNYISFRFKGGAADYVRRVRRVRTIAEILLQLGFATEVKEDLVYARMQKYGPDEIGHALDMLGRLFQFFRQMDLSMLSDGMVDYVRDAFLAGNYGLDPQFHRVENA